MSDSNISQEAIDKATTLDNSLLLDAQFYCQSYTADPMLPRISEALKEQGIEISTKQLAYSLQEQEIRSTAHNTPVGLCSAIDNEVSKRNMGR